MNKLSEEERQDIRDSIKENLETDFIENYGVWKSSLIDVNNVLKTEVSKYLFITPFMDDLLYTYNELCAESLNIVDSLPLTEKNLDPNLISREITKQVTYNRLEYLLRSHLYRGLNNVI